MAISFFIWQMKSNLWSQIRAKVSKGLSQKWRYEKIILCQVHLIRKGHFITKDFVFEYCCQELCWWVIYKKLCKWLIAETYRYTRRWSEPTKKEREREDNSAPHSKSWMMSFASAKINKNPIWQVSFFNVCLKCYCSLL